MASGCLSLFLADQILENLASLEKDGQLISRGLKGELGKLKNSVSAVRAAFLRAEGSGQWDKGLADWACIDDLEEYLCKVDLLVNELFCWVRERKRERERSVVVMPMRRRNLRNTTFTNLFLTNSPMKPFQKEIKKYREELERFGREVFANISDRIKSGEEISIDSFGGDTEGQSSYRKNKDEVIQSLIPPFLFIEDWKIELLKSIGRRLLFENDDDDPDDVAINTLTNIFYFKYSSFYYSGRFLEEQVNIIFPERVLNDLSTRLMQRYALLPLPLKYCFDYCSLFPRDYVIEVPLLLKLWMAQGFAVDEDWGRCYFQYLFNAGFFEKVESDVLETTKCRMDSHDFALSAIISGSTYVLLRTDGQNYIEGAFHVSFDFHLYSQRQIPRSMIASSWSSEVIRSFLLPCQLKSKSDRGMIDPKKIRNIISPHHDSGTESVSDLLISKLDALRALELHDLAIQSLPDYIDRLKHLRYLDVSRNPDIKLLPDSITKLWHLQTLKLSSCFGLRELPKDMKNLIHLRHLEIEGCYNLRNMPPHLGHLTNLQTLSQFVLNDDVRSAHDHKYCSQLKELGRLDSLRGELKIKNLSSILSKDGACKAAALGEKHLQSVTLEWGVGEGRTNQYESQLEDLQPHQNLKELSLNDYWGVNLSSWLLSGNHVQLVKFTLRRCHECKVLPKLHLPTLKSLVLDDMAALEYIEELFPSLQELWLTELPKLKGWQEVEVREKSSFRCLFKLIIQDCPELVSIPLFPTLEEELMLDTTSLKRFQETLTMEKTQKNPVSPPLSKLKKLSLVGIDELKDSIADEIPWEALKSLSVLKLDCLTNLDKLPSKLQHLTNLKELHIWRCKMTVLPEWIKDLQSLDKLAIWVCPYMKSLPEGIRSLSPLKTLEIEDCPTLLQRCERETGADWDKIKHIPNHSGQLSAGKKESLVLEWLSSSPTNDQYQLEDLKPHMNLKRLTLRGYGGLRLSSWQSSWLQSLTSLCILELDNMPNLKYISNEGGGLPMVFPSLRELWLKKLPQLKRWWKDDVKLQSLPSFHCLSKLIIQDCPKLVSIPLFPTLEEELMLDTTSLKPFQRTLMMEKSHVSPPLSKLQNLSFVGIKEFDVATADGIPWKTLTSLRVLKLDFLTNLEELPSNLQHLTNLKELHIRRCKMTALPEWIKDLQSLEKLAIWVCPYMESLPEGIRSLASLKTLEIEDCPTLLQGCQKETGADWDKIKHIPNLSGQLSAGKKESLVLEWSSSSPTNDQYQLEDLKPHKNLKRLTLRGYGGLRLSSWLQSFTSLCILVLDNMPNLKYISNEGGGLPMVFPSLRELWLKKLPQLKRWWKDDVKLQSLPSFPCLSKLIIQDCPKLVSIPLFPTLEEELMLDTTSLKPFQRTLMMENTQKSHLSPPLSKLQNLSFVGMKELDVATADGIPWETLTSLRVLKLDLLTNLEELSNLRHLTNLNELHIRRCKMTALPEWIQHLQSIEKLAIRSCPSMESLPEWIDFLTSLEIEDCPTLLQRCQKETGADWCKIKHIPNLSGQLSAGKKEQRGED